MLFYKGFSESIFQLNTESFAEKALEVFTIQAKHCKVYQKYLQLIDRDIAQVQSIEQIPFLPIELFKEHAIVTGDKIPERYFESSGTTSSLKSRHFVSDISVYETSAIKCFELFFGDVKEYAFLALLPSYLDRSHASLVYMCSKFMELNKQPLNGFYLNQYEELLQALNSAKQEKKKCILIGVSYALLDFAEKYSTDLSDMIVMETGGMKGRREELLRKELHQKLSDAFHLKTIYSEYGMTELFSQAYSKADGIFHAPPWMKIFTRDAEDPFYLLPANKSGCINIIDLANFNSCCFIATQDLGKVYEDGSFEIMGRYDLSDVRGCNLMIE